MLFMSCVCHAFASFYCCSVVGLTAWLLFVMFNCVLSLSHVVFWVRCSTWLYRFLIFAIILTYIHFTGQICALVAAAVKTKECLALSGGFLACVKLEYPFNKISLDRRENVDIQEG